MEGGLQFLGSDEVMATHIIGILPRTFDFFKKCNKFLKKVTQIDFKPQFRQDLCVITEKIVNSSESIWEQYKHNNYSLSQREIDRWRQKIEKIHLLIEDFVERAGILEYE